MFAVAAVCYLGCFETLHYGFYRHGVITDTPVYINYANAMARGELPYRDFSVEYPPGALLAFAAPNYIGSNYNQSFWWIMAALGVAGLGFVVASRAPLAARLPSSADLAPC